MPEGYKHANATNRYSLLIRNDAPAASRISHSVSYTLSSGSYYRIDVMMKVDIPQSQSAERPDYMGAYIGISDTEYYASDIKTTTSSDDFYHDEGDPDDYRMVTFFIHTSGTAATEGDDTSSTDTSDTIVSLEFGIGGTDSRDNWAIGSLYVNSITVSQSDASTFAEAQSNAENGGALYGKYNIIADYSDRGDDAGLKRAMELYARAEENGSAYGAYDLGWVYVHRLRDAVNALPHFERAVELGAYDAYWDIASLYYGGELIPQDLEKAFGY